MTSEQRENLKTQATNLFRLVYVGGWDDADEVIAAAGDLAEDLLKALSEPLPEELRELIDTEE